MANASAITVTTLTADSSASLPTADVLDTGSDAVTLSANVAGDSSRFFMQVKSTAAEALTVAVLAGDNPPAQRAGLGDLSVSIAQNATKIIGPLESMRFVQDDGTISVKFTPGGTIAATVTAYKLPKV